MPSVNQQIFTDRKVLAHALGQEVASVTFFVEDDLSTKLPTGISLIISIRIFGIQVGSQTISPLANGDVDVPLAAGIGGPVKGRIDDFRAIDANGSPSQNWTTAAALAFKISALFDVPVDDAAIANLIPAIGWLAKLALQAVGNRFVVTIAHDDIVAHLPRTP